MRKGHAWISVGCGLLVVLGALPPALAQGPSGLPTSRPPMTAKNADQIVELAVRQGPSDGISSVALSPDGNLLAFGGYKDNDVHLVEVATGKELGRLQGHTAPVTGLAFSPDGSMLASRGTVHLPPTSDTTIRLWDVKTHSQRVLLQTAGLDALAFSPDGALLAHGDPGKPEEVGQVTLWDGKSGAKRHVLPNSFLAISFSPDGGLLAAGSMDDLVHVWDIAAGKESMLLTGHRGQVKATAFSPDSTILASGSDDMTVRLWQAASGEESGRMNGHTSGIAALAFSPDGSVLASLGSSTVVKRQGSNVSISTTSGDQVVRLWATGTRNQIALLNAGTGVSRMAFSRDWTLLVTGGSDGMIRFWGIRPRP